MLECLILGDSIAAGIATMRPDCVHVVKSGINSANWLKDNRDRMSITELNYRTTIISLGSNDYQGIDTEDNVEQIRKAVRTERVYWVLPSAKIKPKQRELIILTASRWGDFTIDIDKKDLSPDRIHPTTKGYKNLGNLTR